MARSVNKVILIGRLGADPELRYTGTGTAVCNLSLATNEAYKDAEGNTVEKTEWHRVVAWSRLAEICGEYLKKGSQVYFEGSLQTRSYEDKDGVTKYTTEIKAREMMILGGRETGDQGGYTEDTRGYRETAPSSNRPTQQRGGPQRGRSSGPEDFPAMGDNDDLPF